MTDMSDSGELSPEAIHTEALAPTEFTPDRRWYAVAALLIGSAAVSVAGGVLSGLLFEGPNGTTIPNAQRITLITRGAEIGVALLVLVAIVVAFDRRVASPGLMTAAVVVAVVIGFLAAVQAIDFVVTPAFRHQIGSGAVLTSLGAPTATIVVSIITAFAGATSWTQK